MAVSSQQWLWIVFGAVVLGTLAVDLGVFNRHEHKPTLREALTWTGVWIGLALAFNVVVFVWLGHQPALTFLTGFIIEKALSVDNIFVLVVLFEYFAVPREYQHRVLFWGVLGAFVLRGVFIFVGSALIAKFHWLIYLFGAFLVFTGIKILAQKKEAEVDPSKSLLVRGFRRLVPVTESYDNSRFLTRASGRLMATPLMMVLVVVEGTDVVFAVDSIPAIFGITTDPFIVYTSNVFAILGLRNLYFVLADLMDRFRYLKIGLGLVLAFVGAKMLLSKLQPVPIGVSLAVIATVLVGSIVASLWATRRSRRRGDG